MKKYFIGGALVMAILLVGYSGIPARAAAPGSVNPLIALQNLLNTLKNLLTLQSQLQQQILAGGNIAAIMPPVTSNATSSQTNGQGSGGQSCDDQGRSVATDIMKKEGEPTSLDQLTSQEREAASQVGYQFDQGKAPYGKSFIRTTGTACVDAVFRSAVNVLLDGYRYQYASGHTTDGDQAGNNFVGCQGVTSSLSMHCTYDDPLSSVTLQTAIVCSPSPQHYLIDNGNSVIACVGDTFSGYVPTGYKYRDKTYTGPAMNYDLTLTDLSYSGSAKPYPGLAYSGATFEGVVATFDVRINGRSAGQVTDFSDPSGVDITDYTLDVPYVVAVQGEKAPLSFPLAPPPQTDIHGKKYGYIIMELRHPGVCGGNSGVDCSTHYWQSFTDTINSGEGNFSLPPCNLGSCGTSAVGGDYICLQNNNSGKYGWIRNNDNSACHISQIGAMPYSCPGQTFTCQVAPGSQYGNIVSNPRSQPGVVCTQDSDCAAPSGSNAYCIKPGLNPSATAQGTCMCGSSVNHTPFGENVNNQVDCALPAAGTPPTSCSLAFTPIKAQYCVGDTVQYSVTSVPAGITAYAYQTKNGVPTLNNATVGSVTTNSTTTYTFTQNDTGNYDTYYVVDAGGGHTCTTNHIVATVADCSSGNPSAASDLSVQPLSSASGSGTVPPSAVLPPTIPVAPQTTGATSTSGGGASAQSHIKVLAPAGTTDTTCIGMTSAECAAYTAYWNWVNSGFIGAGPDIGTR